VQPEQISTLSTLTNGLRIVEALVDGELGISELARRLDLPRQGTYRLVRTLIAAGWLERRPATDDYRLTAHFAALGMRSMPDAEMRELLSDAMRDLAATVGETVHLAIYDSGEVVYVDKREGSEPIRAYSRVGGRAPAHCVATGKMLLALQSDEERERVLATPLEGFTQNTLTNPIRLRQELHATAARGYAVNNGEWRESVGGVAVPVFSLGGEVLGSLGFSGPVTRIAARAETLARTLAQAVEGAMPQPQGSRGAGGAR
jgi:DNA-binding IclR family transcriptional regulator